MFELNKYYISNINKYFSLDTSSDLIIYSILCIILYFIIINIKNSNKKFRTSLYIISIMYVILLLIDIKQKTNPNLTNIFIKPEYILNDLNTGDILLFRCYESSKIGELITQFGLLYQNIYVTHIGMIYKDNDNNKITIIESNAFNYFCEYKKIIKSGTHCTDFINRCNNASFHRIHVFKSNLHQFIDNDKLKESIKKYHDYDFNENGVYCIKLIVNILHENGVLKDECIVPYLMDDLIDPKNYTVPVKFEQPIKVREPDFFWL